MIDNLVVIDKKVLEEKLKYANSRIGNSNNSRIKACYMQEKILLEELLNLKSSPLKPILSDCFDAGNATYTDIRDVKSDNYSKVKEDYLSTIKL